MAGSKLLTSPSSHFTNSQLSRNGSPTSTASSRHENTMKYDEKSLRSFARSTTSSNRLIPTEGRMLPDPHGYKSRFENSTCIRYNKTPIELKTNSFFGPGMYDVKPDQKHNEYFHHVKSTVMYSSNIHPQDKIIIPERAPPPGTYNIQRLMSTVPKELFEKNSSSFKSSGKIKPISKDTNLYLSPIAVKELARVGPGTYDTNDLWSKSERDLNKTYSLSWNQLPRSAQSTEKHWRIQQDVSTSQTSIISSRPATAAVLSKVEIKEIKEEIDSVKNLKYY